jgi:hypothetical protein
VSEEEAKLCKRVSLSKISLIKLPWNEEYKSVEYEVSIVRLTVHHLLSIVIRQERDA